MKYSSCFVLLSVIPLQVFAGDSQPAEPPAVVSSQPPSWTVRTALYGWAQTLDGDIMAKGIGVPVEAGFDDIMENLDMAAMGMIEASHGRWSFQADMNYAKIGSDGNLGPLATEIEVTQFLGNFTFGYDVVKTDKFALETYAGIRVNWTGLDVEIKGGGPAGVNLNRSDEHAWVDPIIGGRFQAELSERFFFRAVGDIGGLGAASELTWQAMAGCGWRMTDSGSLLLGYRGIGTDYSDGGFRYDVVAHGPVLGYELKF